MGFKLGASPASTLCDPQASPQEAADTAAVFHPKRITCAALLRHSICFPFNPSSSMKLRHTLPALLLGLSLIGTSMPPSHAAPKPETPATPDYQAVSANTRAIAEPYLQAYLKQDWARMAELMDEQISFLDPSAKLVFGDLGQQGKSRMMAYLKATYPYIETHSFKLERSFFAGEQAVFIGVSDWSFSPPAQPVVRSVIPLVIAFKIKGDKVVEHQEMGDLQPYLDALSTARQNTSTPSQPAAQAQAK